MSDLSSVNIGSENGLAPYRCQAIIWNNADQYLTYKGIIRREWVKLIHYYALSIHMHHYSMSNVIKGTLNSIFFNQNMQTFKSQNCLR